MFLISEMYSKWNQASANVLRKWYTTNSTFLVNEYYKYEMRNIFEERVFRKNKITLNLFHKASSTYYLASLKSKLKFVKNGTSKAREWKGSRNNAGLIFSVSEIKAEKFRTASVHNIIITKICVRHFKKSHKSSFASLL